MAAQWQHRGSTAAAPMTEPASFDGARLGGGVLVGLDGAHAHVGHWARCRSMRSDRFLFSHVP